MIPENFIPEATNTQTTLTPQDIATASTAYWCDLCQIELQAGRFTLKGHEYELEILDSPARRIIVCKSTQMGMTEVAVLRTLHGLITGKFPQGALYVFPTELIVSDFSKSRFAPLIAKNRKTIGRFVQQTDAVGIKKIGSGFLYLRSGRLSQKVEQENESSQLRSLPCDAFCLDEIDLMDEDIIEKARGRLAHSNVKSETFLSNPSIPDFGIDRLWKQGDMRYWFRKCQACGEWTCAELSFPNCVKEHVGGPVNGHRGYVACDKCGRPVAISPGEWRPTCVANSDFGASYRLSQLTSVFNDPWEILEAVQDPKQTNIADVYRLRLGIPYVAAEDQLQESQVLALCGNDYGPTGHPGPSALGLDVGKTSHCVIGVRTGHDQYEILRAVAVAGWSDVHDLAKRYNVKSAVIDIRPYEDSARAFQAQESFTIHLCEYSESMPSGPQFNANTGIVRVNRTEAFDASHRLITTPGMLRLPRYGKEMQEFAKQVCGAVKVSETNKKTGLIVYRYRTVGTAGDHFRNALNYFMLAASGGKVARVDAAAQNRPRHAINNFHVGVRR